MPHMRKLSLILLVITLHITEITLGANADNFEIQNTTKHGNLKSNKFSAENSLPYTTHQNQHEQFDISTQAPTSKDIIVPLDVTIPFQPDDVIYTSSFPPSTTIKTANADDTSVSGFEPTTFSLETETERSTTNNENHSSKADPETTENPADAEALNVRTETAALQDDTVQENLMTANPNFVVNSATTTSESPQLMENDFLTEATSISTDIPKTASESPTNIFGHNGASVHNFFQDLRTHTILCIISLLLLFLVLTVILSFLLAIIFTIKFIIMGIVKIFRVVERWTLRFREEKRSGVQNVGSIFYRDGDWVNVYGNPRIPIDRNMY